MRLLIVFNHPYKESYCHAILKAVIMGANRANHEIDLINLDEDGFDPVMRAKDLKAFVIARNQQELSLQLKADHLIFIFPIWWELMPALTKGFVDKVIFPGIAYDTNKNGTRLKSRLTNLKGVTMITTMNTPSIAYKLLFGNAIKRAMLLGTFWKIGVSKRKWINLHSVKFCSDKKRNKWLISIEKKFSNIKI